MRPTLTATLLVLVFPAYYYQLILASAASLTDLPACAQPCAFNGAHTASCSSTDYTCICTSKAFWDSVPFCVLTACPPTDQDAALKLASGLCANAGSPLNGTIASDIAAALSSDLASLASGLVTAATGIGGAVSSALANAPATTTTTTATPVTAAGNSTTLRLSTTSLAASTAALSPSTAAPSPTSTKAASQAAAKGEGFVGGLGLVVAALVGVVGAAVLL